uniref:Uncharacterized protein n=1 Tax=Vitrella brassicaformis TaxID=1169539 RepID=A0A7S1KHQ0_9ALVE|mmetsp:Transcript_6379/g.15396  ORF Transcript_6379/g.15396 Transcript_6379/m.15396 type:complete len:116 (+) Transcript_6379:242-589(+)
MNRALRPPLLLCCASPSHDTEMPERFKTVELSGLSNADIVAIFAHDEELRDLVDTARTEKMNGATFAAILDTDNMTVRKVSDEVLGSHIKLGEVALIVRWLKGIDQNAVQVPLST